MADPISLLRHYNMTKKDIIEKNDQIIFGDIAWPRSVPTNYYIYGTGKNGSAKEYYTLGCLLFFLKNVEITHPKYVKLAAAASIPAVTRADRVKLVDYLTGKSDTCPSIDKSAPIVIPSQLAQTEDDSSEIPAKKARTIEFSNVQKVKEQLAARLDAPREATVNVDNIKSLSDAMSVEKIAAIKAKRLALKRTTIKGADDVAAPVEPALRQMLEFDVDVTKEIVKHERQWRTRKTILQSRGKIFNKSILAILQTVKARKEVGQQNSNATRTNSAAPPGMASQTMSTLPGMQAGYNRYDQERFSHTKAVTEGFKIDTMGTYHGMTLKSVTEGNDPKKPVASVRPTLKAPTTPLTPPSAFHRSGMVPTNQKRISRTPIIIIPSSVTSLITMYNVKDILEELKYVTVQEKKTQGTMRENEILLQRRRAGETVNYRVVDTPQKLTNAEWERVCAVFVMGPVWQFKGWPWNGNPVDIFTKVCAFHLKYDEMKLDANVAKWAVNVIDLSRTKRHLDRAALMVFWEKLDRYMVQKKPHLTY